MKKSKTRRDFLKIARISAMGILSTFVLSGCNSDTQDLITLTTEQKETLLFMYQEEKVARDVYITLGELYPGENTFANIQISEQEHIDAVENLCIKYGVDISEVNEDIIGEFVLPELQEMYDGLIIAGRVSLIAALEVGELIEVTDIADLEEASIGMPADIVKVFTNLKNGSINHLAAFQTAIINQ